jgi:hypothetical protein
LMEVRTMRVPAAFLALLLMIGAALAQGSITSSTPDIQVTPQTGGGYSIGTQAPIANQSTAGGPILAGAGEYAVKIGNFPYTIAPAGSAGFGSGWSTLLVNVSKTSGVATITTTGGAFEGAGGGSAISLLPGDWAALTADGSSYLVLIGRYVSIVTPDGTKSSSPNGPYLTTADGVWSWGTAWAGRPGEYRILLNGVFAPGVGYLIEVAHGGQLYANTSGGWYVFKGTAFVSSSAP